MRLSDNLYIENKHNVNFSEFIKNYSEPTEQEHNCIYPIEFINELFTFEQATELKQYLDDNFGDNTTTTINKWEFPIENNIMGVSSIAVGGNCDFYMLYKHDPYPLKFKTMGYYYIEDAPEQYLTIINGNLVE